MIEHELISLPSFCSHGTTVWVSPPLLFCIIPLEAHADCRKVHDSVATSSFFAHWVWGPLHCFNNWVVTLVADKLKRQWLCTVYFTNCIRNQSYQTILQPRFCRYSNHWSCLKGVTLYMYQKACNNNHENQGRQKFFQGGATIGYNMGGCLFTQSHAVPPYLIMWLPVQLDMANDQVPG